MKGKTLVGTTYQPLFPYFAHLKAQAALPNGTAANGVHRGPSGAFRVISDAYVRDDSGTGVVHQAPAFGEDDFRICIENGRACCPVSASSLCRPPLCPTASTGALPVTYCISYRIQTCLHHREACSRQPSLLLYCI